MSKKRIGILVGSQFPSKIFPNNIETISFNLEKMLSDVFSFDLIGSCRVPNRLKPHFNIYNYISIPRSKFLNWIYDLVECYRYTVKVKPNLLLNITQPQYAMIAAIVGRLTQTPVIVTMSGNIVGHKLDLDRLQKVKWFIIHNILRRIAFYLADKVIVLGDNLKKNLLKYGFDESKIAVIPQPIDQDRFFRPVNKEFYKEKIGIKKENKMILFVGRIERLKGTEALLQIIPKALKNRSDIVFYLIGEGPDKKEFQVFNQKSVKLTGKVPHEKIDVYYKAADLLILPSMTEGLPNVILEALACGVPVIANPVGEIPSLISNTFNNIEDYINYILNGKWEADRLPEEFSWEKLKEEYINLFTKVIE